MSCWAGGRRDPSMCTFAAACQRHTVLDHVQAGPSICYCGIVTGHAQSDRDDTCPLTWEEGRRSGAGTHNLPQPEVLRPPDQVALPRLVIAGFRKRVLGVEYKILFCPCQRAAQRGIPRLGRVRGCTTSGRELKALLKSPRPTVAVAVIAHALASNHIDLHAAGQT